MILDNKNANRKVHEWLGDYTDSGKMDIVTGYFTVGALACLSRRLNEKIDRFRLVLGDIVNVDVIRDRGIDLLGENISAEAAFELGALAREAVEFLLQDKVELKTLEPNFCHAKVYLFNPEKDERHRYFISGSSNLTEAGIGLKATNNLELNLAETGDNNQYRELIEWFERLWGSGEAHRHKTLFDDSGRKRSMPFKEYLIEAIGRIFIKYSPRQIYYKMLFELFGPQLTTEQDNPDFNRQVGRLENTVVFQCLYDFQRNGALSLIKMLLKHDGAILADAVGLGKTWTALAVMKFFQLQGREVVLLCPKKLRHNWRRYQRHQNSRFERDQLDFFIRFHTDLHAERMDSYHDRADKFFTSDKPRLFVIDESHNLRNGKSKRYNFLVGEILAKNADAKVLMLSATPINNTLIDIRNQFKLIRGGRVDGFAESHGVRNIDHLFNRAQNAFFKWREADTPRIADFIKSLPTDFFRLTDSLVVARTRQMVESQNLELRFPAKHQPENIFVTPRRIGNFDSFEELVDHFPPLLSGYQLTFYVEQASEVAKIHDERQRDRFLVQMMYILLVKRLESSWKSFQLTVGKILAHHQNALDKVYQYERTREESELGATVQPDLFAEDEFEDTALDLSIGGARGISAADIDRAGNLQNFKADLKRDIDALDLLHRNLGRFEEEVARETRTPGNLHSIDEKLQSLIERVNAKRQAGRNQGNPKVLVFTVYKDTAFYLFDQLVGRGYKNIAVVSGDAAKTDTAPGETKKFEPILERFAPFTKLFMEKQWDFTPSDQSPPHEGQYVEWRRWIADNDPTTRELLENPIDILIATDVLSEGQNLQDCDMVVNYDIHWNPVRVIQRMGRVDRIGSPNREIFGVNYWPSDSINAYLDLKGRVEQRMAMMKLAGSEVHLEFSESFREMATDADFEDKLNERMLRQMETSWEEIEEHQSGLGFDNLSLDDFRQDLLMELAEHRAAYENMPRGVYSGIAADSTAIPGAGGIIALLGYPAKPPKALDHHYQNFDLVLIDHQGKAVIANQKEVLDLLARHKDSPRSVPEPIDRGDPGAIAKLAATLRQWLATQAGEAAPDSPAKAGAETRCLLAKLKTGDSAALGRLKQNLPASAKYNPANVDLVAWLTVSKE